ncbi:hypothetical protein C0989_010553 [Termitomyces sp. Mn162]|nr:hypothetical protein C0989_010553 [Termitomyces sp. Mn162]
MSVLNGAIQTLNLVNNLVPLEIGKGVLASVSGILEYISKQSSVDGILVAVEAKTKNNIGLEVFHVTVNQETIVKWRNELDRILNLFNMELNISATLKLDELLSSFQEFRSNAAFNLEANAQVPEVLPVRPKVFIGRDKLVQNILQPLLQCRDVALIGPGGIGKSSIARAVLNDQALASKFHNRFYVRYDDMDAAQITFGTFLDRIVKALGLTTSANADNMINKALSTSETLLVLDNAETFLDAAVDASRIADAIDGFGSRPNVAILLTTRTTVLPPNLEWTRVRVPALEEDALLIKLLSAVDFHPLSINLLAQAALQNEWSPQDLVDAWDRQRIVLLDAGDGKIWSIAITIETSLNSPSVVKLGDTIYHLLQIIAFLPQGISKKRLSAIFPGVSDIESCADALCRQSLAYLNGNFITLLAPIRLYVSERYNVQTYGNPLLKKVRQYYAAHVDEKEIVYQDDVNMEHVFAHWVVDPEYMVYVLRLIYKFVYALFSYRPRPVSLRGVISALDPDESCQSVSCIDSFKIFTFSQLPRRLQVSLEKGTSLFAISVLLRWIGQIKESEEITAEAWTVLLETGRQGRVRLIFFDCVIALIYIEQGNFQVAERLLQSASKRLSTMFRPQRDLKDPLRYGLALVRTSKGEPGASEDILKALSIFRRAGDPEAISNVYYDAGYAEFHDGRINIAKKYFEEARARVDETSTEDFVLSLLGLADVADHEGDHSEAKGLRARALASVQKISDRTVPFANRATAILAGYLAMDGHIEQARELIVPAVANATKQPAQSIVVCKYLAGMIELIDGDFDKAQNYFQEAVEECVSMGEFNFRARSERALGEVAVIKGDLAMAKKHFEATTELCKTMGIPRKCLYRDFACYIPNKTFDGWERYQDDMLQT